MLRRLRALTGPSEALSNAKASLVAALKKSAAKGASAKEKGKVALNMLKGKLAAAFKAEKAPK